MSQLIILITIICTHNLSFATNDDTTMVALSAGGYGQPSVYIINMHIIIGYLLKILFSIFPIINWVTIFFLIVYLLCFFLLDRVFDLELQNVYYWGVSIVLNIIFLIVISYFSFTVVAYTAAISGIITLFGESLKKIKHNTLNLALGICMLIIASLIRGEVFKSLIVGCIPVIIMFGLLKKNMKIWIITALLLLLPFISEKSNMVITNTNEFQKDFLEWGETRSAALDCQVVPYDFEIFERENISAAQYNAIYNAFYYIYDSVSLDVMQEIITLNTFTNKYNFDIIAFFESHFSYLNNLTSFDYFYKSLFAIVLILFLFISSKENFLFLCLTWISVIGTEFAFFFINRPLYRVIMPGYLIGILLIILCCDIKEMHFNTKYKKSIAIVFMLTIGIWGVSTRIFNYSIYAPWLYSTERKQVLEYMESNNEKLFLAGDAGVFSIGTADSIWNCRALNNGWNLIGNWETYSVPYMELAKKHNIQDPYNIIKEAIDNKNILILTRFGDDFPESYSWILTLINEYYGLDVEFKKLENISVNKVTDEYSENWAVYMFVEKQKG